MATIWVNRYSTRCGSCDSRVEVSALICPECNAEFTSMGTHFMGPGEFTPYLQKRPDLQWIGVHPERWNP